MMRILSFILLFLIFSCERKTIVSEVNPGHDFTDVTNSNSGDSIEYPIYLETPKKTILQRDFSVPFRYNRNTNNFYEVTLEGLQTSSYWIEYIGYKNKWYEYPKEVANDLEYSIHHSRLDDLNYRGKDTIYRKVPLSLEIDTTQMVLSRISENYGFPVYIINKTNHTTYLSLEPTLPMILQAQDQNKTWKSLEYYYFGFCGNGYTNYILKPESYIVSSILKTKGDFETNLRIKFAGNDTIIYSNIFRGKIPSSILKQKIDNEKENTISSILK